MKKPSRKVRKYAKHMIAVAALANKNELEKLYEQDTKIMRDLDKKLDEALLEAYKKSSENIKLAKELGQVRCEYRKLSKSNEAFSREYNRMQDDNIALKQENLGLQRQIIDQDYKIQEKDKLLQEKDDLIQYLKQPFWKRLFSKC
ncbi:MAG: hypothetical protein ACI3T9_02230 [Romboutsia timonensis]